MALQKETWLALLGVIAFHALLIALALWSPNKAMPAIEPATVQGVLISLPPAPVISVPKVTPPPEKKVEPPKPKPQPKPKPTPKPVLPPPIEAPPTEKSITQEKVEEPALEEVAEEAAPEAPLEQIETVENEPVGAPEITPPQEDAANINNPKPPYPNMSRRLGETGTVVLEVLVLPNGRVGDARIKKSSGFKRLDDTALRSVRNWRYLPAKRGDQAIEHWYEQDIEFNLD